MKNLLVALLLLSTSAFASDKVELEVQISLNNEVLKSQRVETELGAAQTITADGVLNVILTPTFSDSLVTIDAKIQRFEHGEYKPYKTAKVELPLSEKSYIVVGNEPGELYEVNVTTRKI